MFVADYILYFIFYILYFIFYILYFTGYFGRQVHISTIYVGLQIKIGGGYKATEKMAKIHLKK